MAAMCQLTTLFLVISLALWWSLWEWLRRVWAFHVAGCFMRKNNGREREGKKREQPTNYLSHPGQVPGSCQPANGLVMRPKIKAFRPQRTLASLACLPALSPSAMQALVPLTRGGGGRGCWWWALTQGSWHAYTSLHICNTRSWGSTQFWN